MENIKLPISVVISTMNRPVALQRTLYELMSKEYIPSQIVIIDQSNHKDNLASNEEILTKYKKTVSTTYQYQSIPSLTKSRNLGLKCAKYDTVIYMDDDVDVSSSTLYEVHHAMRESKVALIGGLDNNTKVNGSPLGYIFGIRSFYKRKIGQVALSIHGSYPLVRGVVNTEWAMGYFFVVRKSLIEKWGLKWDENLTSYGYAEDLDFSYSYYKKASSENLSCILSDKIVVTHLVSKEWRITTYKNTLMYVINREYLSYKHFNNPISRIATRWANLGEIIHRIITRNRPLDLLKAQYLCDKYRYDIKLGNLNSFKYN